MNRLTTVPQASLIKCCGCIEESNCYADVCCDEIDKAFDQLRKYENSQEKIERRVKEIKASVNYPHNFMGQMVEDFEWALSLIK